MATKIVAGSGYGNVFIDSLIWGGRTWDERTPIKVYLGEPEDVTTAAESRGDSGYMFAENVGTIQPWTNMAEDAVFLYALELYSSVCNLKFDVNTTLTEADILWWKVDLSVLSEGIVGIHENLGTTEANQIWGYFNPYVTSWETLHFGGDALNTVIHEIGHGLGLAHPHDGGQQPDATTFPGIVKGSEGASGNMGNYQYNQGVNSVMSYVPGSTTAESSLSYGAQSGLGAFDIAALQALYGANYATATGNDVYNIPTLENAGNGYGWFCIWDAGGHDTISGESATTPVIIDLRAATLVYGDAIAGGALSQQTGTPGGFTIANGVVIEDAIGGSGNDGLIGNDFANTLYGRSGSDTLSGGGGNDILHGGGGRDSFVIRGTLNKHANVDRIIDFNVKQDSILLENKFFGKLKKPGKLKKAFFTIGNKAKDKNDFIVYNKKKGVLYYDFDGAGGKGAVEFAKMKKKLNLKYDDFIVI